MTLTVRCLLCLALPLAATAARADVAEAVQNVLLPGYARFADASTALDQAATADCGAEGLKPAFQATFDAWMAVEFVHIGPGEEDGTSRAIAYWPDPKGLGAKAQDRLAAAADPAALDPATFAHASLAGRGLFGLERLLYAPPAGTDPDYLCAMIRATSRDLSVMAGRVNAGWQDYTLSLTDPGETRAFHDRTEARQALLTEIAGGLEMIAETRLGRPMGTFDAPAPDKAEAALSGRALQNVRLSLATLRATAATLSPGSTATLAAFDRAIAKADRLNDPVFAGVADPQGRLKVEILQGAVKEIQDKLTTEMTAELGAGVGLNADGD